MRKLTALFLAVFLILNTSLAYAVSSSSGSSSGSSSSSGGGGGGTSSGTSSVPLYSYTVKGNITLPEAAKADVTVYAFFGGVTFETASLSSEAVSQVSETSAVWEKQDSVTTADYYSNEKIVAVIPKGQSSASYEAYISISSSYKAFYGRFRTDSEQFSNKTLISQIAMLSEEQSEYELDIAMEKSDGSLSLTASVPQGTSLTKSVELYVSLEGKYDTYIKNVNVPSSASSFDISINAPSGEYKISYFIPDGCDVHIKSGLYVYSEKINTDISSLPDIELQRARTVSGKISLENDKTADSDITLSVTAEAWDTYEDISVNAVISKGTASASYIIRIEDDERYSVIFSTDSKYYFGGISDNHISADSGSVENMDFVLKEAYPVHGVIYVPDSVEMSENTYFTTKIYIENTTKNTTYSTSVKINSDIRYAEYLMKNLPECFDETDNVILYYNFGDVTELPSSPYNPLKKLKSSSSGSSGGSGGGSSGGSYRYTYEMPDGISAGHNFYIKEGGSVTTKKSEAKRFNLKDEYEKNITLAVGSAVNSGNTLGGWFSSALSHKNDISAEVSLISTADGSVQTKSLRLVKKEESVSYVFENIEDGEYILKYNIDGDIFYFNNYRLTADINSAKKFTILGGETVYGFDVWYKNVYPANAAAVAVNGGRTLTVYDILGAKLLTAKCGNRFYIPVSRFILGCDGMYFSKLSYDEDEGMYVFSELTDSFENAYTAECKYRDYFTDEKNGGFRIKANISPSFDITAKGEWTDEGNYTAVQKNGSVIEIYTPEQLAWVSYKASLDENRSSFSGITVRLMNDIDLSEHFWFPIGGFSSNKSESARNTFKGTIDGNGHTIKGLTIGTLSELCEYENCGLIGRAEAASVKNLKMENVFINSSGYSGAVLGVGEATLNEITVSGYVTGSYAGGIAGSIDGSIINSSSYANVCEYDEYDYVGGIAGYSYGSIENCGAYGSVAGDTYYTGGIAGYTSASYGIKNCVSDVSGAGCAISRRAYNAEYCIYNSEKCSRFASTSPVPKTIYAMSEDELYSDKAIEILNDNANKKWYGWLLSDDGIPIVGTKKTNVWDSDGSVPELENGAYKISTAKELAWISEQADGGENFYGKSIILTSDIDLTGKFWLPIGNEECSFKGSFDGDGYTIKGIKIKADVYSGLFAITDGAEIKNVKLKSVSAEANDRCGSLIGYAGFTDIESCTADGSVSGNICGGIVGWANNSVLSKTSFSGAVESEGYAGGIAGEIEYSSVTCSSAYAVVTGGENAGGIVGQLYGAESKISDCIFKGSISGDNNLGGIVGYAKSSVGIINTCSDCNMYGGTGVGGIVGYAASGLPVTSSYWNNEKKHYEDGFESSKDIGNNTGSSEEENNCGVTSKQLSDKTTFSGWDFESVWTISKGLPSLIWQTKQMKYTLSDLNVVGNTAVLNVTKNTNDTNTSDKIVYVKYVGGKLCDYIADDLNMDTTNKLIYASRAFSADVSDDTEVEYGIFVWDMNTLTPLAECIR